MSGDVEVFDIGGVMRMRLPDAAKYDYANGDKCRCPRCGRLGIPWGGWFHCESDPRRCGAVYLISSGELYMRVP